jgi:hypothetical protein
MDWRQRLLEILCFIYQTWGRDCSDFDDNPDKAISLISDSFYGSGLPDFPTHDDREKFIQHLQELEAHLALPGNDLSPELNATLNELIVAIWAALNPHS